MDALARLQQKEKVPHSRRLGEASVCFLFTPGEGCEAGRAGNLRSTLLQIYFDKDLPTVMDRDDFFFPVRLKFQIQTDCVSHT